MSLTWGTVQCSFFGRQLAENFRYNRNDWNKVLCICTLLKTIFRISEICQIKKEYIMEYLTAIEISKKWDIFSRLVAYYSEAGRIGGADKQKQILFIIPVMYIIILVLQKKL